MKILRKWLLGACAAALFAGCSSDSTDDPVPSTQLAVPEPVVTVKDDLATVKWVAVENAHQYAWELLKGTEAEPETGTCFTSSCSFTMDEGIVYSFRVMAKALSGSAYLDSDWSAYVVASSNMLATPQPAVDAASLTDTSATLSWSAVEDAGGYKYELTQDGATVKSGTESGLSVTFEDLAEGTAYRFRVLAVSAAEEKSDSPWSEYVGFTTRKHEQLAAPAAAAAERTPSSAKLTWEAVKGAAKYAYWLYEESLDSAPADSGETTATEVTLTGLKELTSYYFTVQALADPSDPYSSDSEVSEALGFRTTSTTSTTLDLGLPAHEQDGVIRAFPGAEGAGMYTTGGRGGKVIHVTNLNDSGEGSLRAALNTSGARTIVFDVAGIIELKSSLEIKYGDVTIAGQTAPGDGICIKTHNMVVKADNVIIRYMHFRPGDIEPDDGLDAVWGRYHSNIILDHCSMSWSTDECSSFYANRNMTMQWCLMAESLHNTQHSKGSHGYGGIWGGAPASFHHNMLAHHDSRNPRFDSPNTYAPNSSDNPNMSVDDRRIDFRNNVVYNFCNYPAYGGEGQRINFVGNYYKWGPASYNGAGLSYKENSDGSVTENANKACRRQYFYSVDGDYQGLAAAYASIYCGDNTNVFDSSVSGSTTVGDNLTANNQAGFIKGSSSSLSSDITWLSQPLSIQYNGQNCYVTTHAGEEIINIVCQYVGASKRRDAVDTRVAYDAQTGTATVASGSRGSQWGIIDSQTDVGGWPAYSATEEEKAQMKDSDGDGIPDYWEDFFGLDSTDAADGSARTLDPQGLYTNLEIYLHYLVKDITLAQTQTGTYTELK